MNSAQALNNEAKQDVRKVNKNLQMSCLLGVMLAIVAVSSAYAANLSVFPLRGELSIAKSSEVFTIRNQGNEPVVVQANVFKWSQKDGQEILDATREVLVAPALIEIPPNESQIVRIAVRRPPDAKKEDSFRLLIQEVPKSRESKDSKIVIALNISLPVFYAPTTAPAQGGLEASQIKLHKDAGKQQVMIDLSNNGTGHVQITSLQVSDSQGSFAKIKTLLYLLPGVGRTMAVAADRVPELGKSVKIEFQTPKGVVVRELVLN